MGITPAYDRNGITIYHGDLRDVLPALRQPADCIVSDVAYETISGGDNSGYVARQSILSKNRGKIFEHNDLAPDDYAGHFFAALRDPSHCYIMTNALNLESMLSAFRRAGFGFHGYLPWIKNNAVRSRWYMKDCELGLMFNRGRAFAIANQGAKATSRIDNLAPREKIHPTEKPWSLMYKWLTNSTRPGETVLDPFAGSGSTLEAAARAGRRAIGVEIDATYVEAMVGRMERYFSQYQLSFEDIKHESN